MKNDINLLYKRKIKTYSNKNIVIIITLIVLCAAGMYAGIAVPTGMITTAEIQASELQSQLNSSTETQQDLTEKTQQELVLSMQLTEIKTFDENRSDITRYMDAVEASLPTDANLTELQFTDENVSLVGIAKDDTVLATFCLRLREQNVFKDVYILSSVSSPKNHASSFAVTATLPSPLSNVPLIQSVEQVYSGAPEASSQPGTASATTAETNNLSPEVAK